MSAPFNDRGPFAVGEICRIVETRYYPELLGTEVKIMSAPLMFRDVNSGEMEVGYGTDLVHKGISISPRESFLRRRRPPASDSHERTYMQKWRDMAGKAPQRERVPA